MKTSNAILLGILGLILLFITTVIIIARTSFGIMEEKWSGENMNKKVEVRNFHSIHSEGRFKIEFTQDSVRSVEIIADSSVMQYVQAVVENDELLLDFNKHLRNYPEIKILISSPELEKIHISAGSYFGTEHLVSKDFIIDGSAGSRFKINGEFDKLKIDLSAGSNMDIEGTANQVEIDGSAGIHIDAVKLLAKSVDVNVSAGAYAEISVSEELNADASAGAIVEYHGSPGINRLESSAGGIIKKK